MTTSNYTSKDVIRFWNKVNKQGSIPEHCPELGHCWEWISPSIDRKGYGLTHFGNRYARQGHAHRFSWIITYGEIESSKIFVLHKCDNPKCVNPTHLFLGTNRDNVDDMIRKGRSLKGEQLKASKVTNEIVIYIRQRYAQGNITMRELGLEVGLSTPSVYHIIHRNTWKHIE